MESELDIILDSPEPSTAAQRRALYRLGRSRSWVHRFADTKQKASQAIEAALAERREIELGQYNRTTDSITTLDDVLNGKIRVVPLQQPRQAV